MPRLAILWTVFRPAVKPVYEHVSVSRGLLRKINTSVQDLELLVAADVAYSYSSYLAEAFKCFIDLSLNDAVV